MSIKKSTIVIVAFISGLISTILAGHLEALFLYFNFGDYTDLYVFAYAAYAYGIFGILTGLGAAIVWLIIGYFKGDITPGRIYWHTFLFFLGAGFYGLFEYTWKTLWGLPNVIPSNVIGIFIAGPIVSILFGGLCVKLDRKLKYRLSNIKLNIIAIIIITVLPGIIGSMTKSTQLQSEIKGPQREIPNSSNPNIILLVADALRADYLSVFNGTFSVPALDSLADDGIRFNHIYSACSWTRPAFASLLSSAYPMKSGIREFLTGRFRGNEMTLQRFLGNNGYYTAGFFNNANLAPDFNFQAGFDSYRYMYPESRTRPPGAAAYLRIAERFRRYKRLLTKMKYYPSNYYWPAGKILPVIESWIGKHRQKPFFILVHLMDSHDPYFPHPYDGRGFGNAITPNEDRKDVILGWKDIYHQEIQYMDSCLSSFFAYLKDEDLYNSSMIIFTADHGEEFYDHRGKNHGVTLYNEVLHIPLIVKLPGNFRKGETKNRLGNIIDIAPTITFYLGLGKPADWQGEDLFSLPKEKNFSAADLKNFGNEIHSITFNNYKLIQNIRTIYHKPKYELFYLADDSTEKHNIADEKPELVEQLNAVLDKLDAGIQTQSDTLSLDKATIERLKALGYIK